MSTKIDRKVLEKSKDFKEVDGPFETADSYGKPIYFTCNPNLKFEGKKFNKWKKIYFEMNFEPSSRDFFKHRLNGAELIFFAVIALIEFSVLVIVFSELLASIFNYGFPFTLGFVLSFTYVSMKRWSWNCAYEPWRSNDYWF